MKQNDTSLTTKSASTFETNITLLPTDQFLISNAPKSELTTFHEQGKSVPVTANSIVFFLFCIRELVLLN